MIPRGFSTHELERRSIRRQREDQKNLTVCLCVVAVLLFVLPWPFLMRHVWQRAAERAAAEQAELAGTAGCSITLAVLLSTI